VIELDELTLHWLAGLLEGEGSFCVGLPSNPGAPFIHVNMADEDVIAKLGGIFEVHYHVSCPKRYREKGWRQAFSVRLTGKRAVELMTLLRPLMGQRRQRQLDRAIADYKGDNRRALTDEQIEEIRRRSQDGENVLELAKEFRISKSLAYYIRSGYIYKRA